MPAGRGVAESSDGRAWGGGRAPPPPPQQQKPDYDIVINCRFFNDEDLTEMMRKLVQGGHSVHRDEGLMKWYKTEKAIRRMSKAVNGI